MRLLVTRPEPDAGETAARLRALGHDVVVAPMLCVDFAAPPRDLPDPAAVVATSRNGIRALAGWPLAAGWRSRPLFVTGEGTAEAARDAGFTDVRPGGGDAVSLAARIAAEMPIGAGPILHAAGRDRAPALATGLRAHDLRVVEAYRAEPVRTLDPPVAAGLARGEIDGVLLFSPRTAAAFAAACAAAGLATLPATIACFVISDRAAEPLRGLARDIRVAAHPDFDGIVAMIADPGAQLA